MLEFVNSPSFSWMSCGLIALVFLIAWRHLQNERKHLAALSRYILVKYRLGHPVELKSLAKEVVDDIARIESARDPVRRQTELDSIWKRAVRLEGSVDFWMDLLQKLGLLGTVLGLGFALLVKQEEASDLLAPLSLAVWTTVVGLLGSIAISWKFGRDVNVEVDAYEESLREWQHALLGSAAEPGAPERPARQADTEITEIADVTRDRAETAS